MTPTPPPLDPTDLPHVPRWLNELREAEATAKVWDVIRRARAARDAAEAAMGIAPSGIRAHPFVCDPCVGCGFPAAGLPAGFHAMRCPTVAERGLR